MTKKLSRIDAGFRSLTQAHIDAADMSLRFEGLDTETKKGNILATLKAAVIPMGIPARLRDALDLLFKYSQEQDWNPGQRPIVWPSNQTLIDELGLCLRQVQNVIRELRDRKLVHMVESPNGHRRGMRDQDGNIIFAYGFDLSPLAVRRQEFIDAIDEHNKMRTERQQLRRDITIVRKAIYQIAATAEDEGYTGFDWEEAVEEAHKAGKVASKDDRVPALRSLLKSLEARRSGAEAAFIEYGQNVSKTCEGEKNCTHTSTTDLQLNESSTVSTEPKSNTEQCTDFQKSSSEIDRLRPRRKKYDGIDRLSQKLEEYKITPRFIANVSPPIGEQLFTDDPTWSDIVESAYRLAHQLGISQSAWGNACQKMGREGAATSVAVIAARKEEIVNPGGYLRGMTWKAEQGELNLGPSIYKLRDQQAA